MKVCVIDGCERTYEAHGWCTTHYARWRRHGDPLTLTQAAHGEGSKTTQGYRMISLRGHPLTLPSGTVLEHRVVLYDAIGPGSHPCHWCEKPVQWTVGERDWDLSLVADHLDGDRLNNVPENLVPACFQCNIRRGDGRRPAATETSGGGT